MFAQLVSGSIDWCVLGSFVVYLILMLGIGFLFSNRQENMGDYFLGGRKMNKWVVALSAQASDMSGWLLMGLPGAIFLGGFSEAWIGIGLLIGTYSQICGDSITIPDFIANRFRDKTGVSRVVAALIILVFFTFYTASGFVSAAKLFSTMFPIAYTTSLWIGALVVVGSEDLDAVSGCFGELMAELFDYKQDHWSPELRSIGFHLGKFIYLLDAYDDLARDEKKGAYNPLRTLSRQPGYEEEMREIFELLLARCARSFERLPCVEDADLLRNILYSGVWLKYNCKQAKETQKK